MTTPATAPGQHLMIAWLRLMMQFTPYMSGIGREAWDAWHSQLKQQTSQFLATVEDDPYNFAPQVISLQKVVSEWLKEYHEFHAVRRGHWKETQA